MIKYEEYQDALNCLCGCDAAYFAGDTAVDLLQLLVDKEYPWKVIDKPYDFGNSYLCCPRCKQKIIKVQDRQEYQLNYCHHCGQHIVWEDKAE